MSKLLIWPLSAVMVLSGCGMFSRDVEEAPALAPPPVRVSMQTAEVTRGTILEKLDLSVTVRSKKEEALFFPVGGRIGEILVTAGGMVEEGEVLAVLEAEDLESRVALARIDEEKARLRLEQARDQKQDAFEERMLELDLQRAHIQTESLVRQLERTRLRAPFAGRVETLALTAGEQIQAFATAVVVVDPDDLEVTGSVTGSGTSKLTIGQQVDLIFPQVGKEPIPATLVSLPAVDRLGRTLPAVFELERPEQRLELGMRGNAAVYLQRRENVLLVPNAAIRRFSGGTFIQVVTGDVRRDVSVQLGLVGEIESEVLSGLDEGQKVVIGQ